MDKPQTAATTPGPPSPAELVGPSRPALAPVRVWWVNATNLGVEDRVAPHRHDYHELLWIKHGHGRHLLDGTRVEAGDSTITVIGRGQIHRVDEAREVTGAVIDFSDEALFDDRGGSEQVTPAWLIFSGTTPTVTVPSSRVAGLEAMVRSLDDEASRPPDERSAALQRHLLCALLLWIDRWQDGHTPTEASDRSARLRARFILQLEHDYTRYHDVAHYAHALAVASPTLAHALHATTGKTTKELVVDRIMLEATRLLRFTDLSISEIAYRCGYADPLYFSRAFKRNQGRSPAKYRAWTRGTT